MEPRVTRTQFEEEEFEYADGGITDQMREAKKIMGEKWDRMSKEEKVKATKYLVMKGEIEGDDEDYEYADGGMMAKGGMMADGGMMMKKGGVPGRNRKRTLEEMAAEAVGSSTWFQLDKETQAGVIAELITEGVLPQRMAKGSKVAEDFSVTYKLADGKSVTEKYSNKDEMDEGIAMFYLNNDVLDAIINEVKPKTEEKPAKKSLFSTESAIAKESKSKTTAPVVEVPGLEDEIERYDELKAVIKNADAEKELIGGKIKEIAKDAYIKTYLKLGVRPKTITIKSGDKDINYTVQDRYKLLKGKETILAEYDNLLGTDYTFTFDKEILDKKGTNGEQIGDIINDLIMNSDDIPEEYKNRIVKVEKKTAVKPGTIERILTYDSPAEIFALIEPVEVLT